MMDSPAKGSEPPPPSKRSVLLLGATGSIGRAVLRELLARGHRVRCLVRQQPAQPVDGAEYRTTARLDDPDSLAGAVFTDNPAVDAVISCMASRTGAPKDAWAVDYQAHSTVLKAAQQAGIDQFVLLSAICVQKPGLAFQQAKLAFEKELISSGVTYSIIRPTAFFKSLSGQVERVREGKPFLVFGDGRQTACKPISDGDLARYIVDCLDDPARQNCILPIGGPGPALTPQEQAELLFAAAGKPAKFSRVPVALLDGIIGVLSTLGLILPKLREKAELARIGRYYATESMLVWDPDKGTYDAAATPEFGSETLADHYRRMIEGTEVDDRGAHKVF